MRLLWISAVLAPAAIVASVSISRGDEPPPEDAEPDVVMPFKGAEAPMKDPFEPYGTGTDEPGSTWSYQDLTADEKAIADRGLDEDQTGVQNAYAAAARAMGQRAKAEGAAVLLGLDVPLEELGVPSEQPPATEEDAP